ncbi:hypothetical protein H9P43_003374 [Blastocladiella emersonii ATCC 22665]|nr:hypothetical protein H9P43_003374 [Blastocladiella emersonii ATCC 22665]
MDKASDANTSTRAPRRDKNKDNPNEPSVIGNYKIDRTLGQGTYGKVKLGLHQQTNEKVAIKIIEKANIQSQRQVARIQREIRFLKLLHHPHIVKVYEVHETAEQIFIVMEYVQGGELFDYIVSHKRVKEKEARAFYRMMLSALHYCHANAVIHRDLKPENLLLDTDKTIKIIDFGFGNTFKPHGLLETFCGSPFYAAPEMILGKKYEGPEVDMWSVGVILFALLCGHLPFDDENIKELYKKIASGVFTCPSYLTPQAKHLIQRLITVDPRKRATLDEVLNHAWVNEGFSRPPHSYLPERPVLRNPAELEPDIINRLHAFGYTQEDIEKAFMEEDHSKPHPIRATYFLLKEMLAREEKKLRDSRKASSATSSTSAAQAAVAATSASAPVPTPAAAPAAAAPQPAPPIITTSAAEERRATTGSANTVSSTTTAASAAAYIPSDADSPTGSPTSSTTQVASSSTTVNSGSGVPLGVSNVTASVTCSLYSISEDESAHGAAGGAGAHVPPPQTGAAGQQQLGISAANKGAFTSMPQVSDTGKSRRASTPESHEHSAPAVPPPVRVPERPRHSTTSLTQSGPRSAPAVAPPGVNGVLGINTAVGPPPPSPGAAAGPLSAGVARPVTAVIGTSAVPTKPAAAAGAADSGKGRRFSLANLTTGSKRRSSTTPAKTTLGNDPNMAPTGAGTTGVPALPPVPGAPTLEVTNAPSVSPSGSGLNPMAPSGGAELAASTSSGNIEAGGDSARAVSSWFLNVNTTSAKPPLEIVAEVKRVLTENHVQFAHDGGYVVECRASDLVFEIEICKVPRLSLFGLHFKRISGGIWSYKKLCNKLLQQMNL